MDYRRAGVLGARSLIGECLLESLVNSGWKVIAFSRQSMYSNCSDIEWRQLLANDLIVSSPIDLWVSLLPIWTLREYFPLLERYGARRIVALSSTSRFTKAGSSNLEEREMAEALAMGEQYFQAWAEKEGKQWTIFRPSLVYGRGRDKNISEIARLIRRFGFFPLVEGGQGLRQPIHANDVAKICRDALFNTAAFNRAYNISGALTMSFRVMVNAVFMAVSRHPRFVPLPLWAARLAISLIRLYPQYSHWSAAMFERMGQDMVFDHEDASRDLGFKPQAFFLSPEDVLQ